MVVQRRCGLVDNVDAAARSRMMAAVKSKDTAPELAIARALHRRGFRYRKHVAKLPGKPDLVFPKYRAVVLVHGCFWHGHDCGMYRLPQTRTEFWREKVQSNRRRDRLVREGLCGAGWRCITVWECALRGPEKRGLDELIDQIAEWLTGGTSVQEVRGIRR